MAEPIKKLPPNAKGQVRYRFVVDAGTDPETGKRKQLRRTFNTLREAKTEYARITSKRNEGTFVPPNKITVNEWLDQWLEMKAEDLEPTTVLQLPGDAGSCTREARERPAAGTHGGPCDGLDAVGSPGRPCAGRESGNRPWGHFG